MKSGRARRNRAWFVSGIVATAAVVVGVSLGGPAPAQVEPLGPEVDYVDAFGPGVYAYVDCDGEVFTEVETVGYLWVELDADVELDTSVTVSYSGSLANDLVEAPTTVDVAAGDFYGEARFELDAVEDGDLTITVEPGIGYVADPDDTYTLEVSEDEPLDTLACEDLGSPPDGTDRQTIEVGETPLPLGFFIDEGVDPGPTTTLPSPSTDSTSTESTTTTEDETTTTEEPPPTDPEQLASPFSALQAVRAVPDGWDTLVANGTLPPGLTYEDDVWAGTATTPGTYAFDIRVCLDQTEFTISGGRTGSVRRPVPRALPDVICFGYVDVEIVVLAADTARPASPISTDAQFTG